MPVRRFLRRFAADERGTIVVEAVLVLPIMIWAYLGTFVFFDGFHAQSINVKVAYTVGDALSRETEVTPEYVDSLYRLQGILAQTVQSRRLRLTAVRFFEDDDAYKVVWSQARGGGVAHTDATLAAQRHRLPLVHDRGVLLVTETWVNYAPIFDVGIEPFTFSDLVVTAPRFASQLCYNTVNDGGTMATATC